jgi:hypothetical protein
MAVPSTNIKMSDIYSGANTGSVPTISVSNLFKKSYFEGPGGSASISYNAWGQYGTTVGADKIYGLTSKNTDNAWSDFSGLTYFYNNSTYLVGLRMDNVLPPPGGGHNNDYTVYVELWDSSYTYTYVTTGAILLTQGTTFLKAYISTSTTPIISNGYWRITFVSNNLDPGLPPVQADITINGNIQALPLTNAPYSTDIFTGTEAVAYYVGFYTGTGLQFDIVIHI